jgi:hypothetical protein
VLEYGFDISSYVYGELQRQILHYGPKVPLERRQNKVEFENALIDAWEGIKQDSIDREILNLKELCKKCLDVGDGHF